MDWVFIDETNINFQPEKMNYQQQKIENLMVIISSKIFFRFFFEMSKCLKMTWLKK